METSSNKKTYAVFSTPANRNLIASIEQTGAKVFQFAPLTVNKNSTEIDAEMIKTKLFNFDWIIFPDVHTVEFFLEILTENEIDLFELDSMGILAFGESVSDRLRFVQLHADIIPLSIDTEAVLSSLLSYLGENKLNKLRFLLPKGVGIEVRLKNRIIDLGANVRELEVYNSQVSAENKTLNLKALLKGGAIDEFIFTRPEDLISFKHYFKTENLTEAFSDANASGVDEVTIQALRENNLHPKFFQIKRG